MSKDRAYWVEWFWARFLFGMAFLPWYAAYVMWRAGELGARQAPTIAFLVVLEVVVLWYARRRRVWWFPRRRS